MPEVFHLYIHLPFCAKRCDYCDFYSTVDKLDLASAYVDAVLQEFREFKELLGVLKTVYLGGGTPTLLGAELLGRLLAAVRLQLWEGAEVTVEANPSTVTPALAEFLRGAGVNRISLGVQSFNRRLRRNLGRDGGGTAAAAVKLLRAAGFANIGLDLIFGIPGQTLADLKEDLKQALLLKPEHISYYELSVEGNSRFKQRWRKELKQARSNSRLFYETIVDTLKISGYRWYETSNFAMPGRECRHNLAYWRGMDYVGIGAAAVSTVGRRRWRNVEDLESYLSAGGNLAKCRDFEELTTKQKISEQLFLGLRMDTGVSLSRTREVIDAAEQKLLQRNGFIESKGDKIRMTRAGRFVANEVCARLFQG